MLGRLCNPTASSQLTIKVVVLPNSIRDKLKALPIVVVPRHGDFPLVSFIYGLTLQFG